MAGKRLTLRWVHVWAILTCIATAFLLTLGGLVTTFRVGMADPVWPTEPWFLLVTSWSEPRPGFLIEHAHRLAGFTVGGMMAVLAIGIWWTEPRSSVRRAGTLGLIVLLASFGQFHRAMMAQANTIEIVWPFGAIGVMVVSLIMVAGCAASGILAGHRGSGSRALGVIALVAVMIQGLLGGFRVRLNAWAGTDLAAVHGIFAQVVFSMLVGLAVLTTAPRETYKVHEYRGRLPLVLTALVFVQLIWGVLVRHHPSALVQRFHLMFAFAVVATAVPLIGSRRGFGVCLLAVFLVLQVMLGVEAWMGKFASGVLPELQRVSKGQAIVRTGHVLIGTGILATSVALVLASRRQPGSAQPGDA